MSGILKTIRRMFRGNKHNRSPEYLKKTANFTSYVEEYGTSFNSDATDEPVSDVSFTSPLESQGSTYDIPSSVYQIPPPKESVASLSNNTALDNVGKASQEPIYATIKKTEDMASQTDLSFPSSESFSSLASSSSDSSVASSLARTIPPPPPPPPPPVFSGPTLVTCKKPQKNSSSKPDARDELQRALLAELEKKLEKIRKANSSED